VQIAKLSIPLLVAAAALAGCADGPAPTGYPANATSVSAPRECFWTRDVNGFAAADQRTVYVRAGVNRVYELDLLGPCPDVDWTEHLALESRGSDSICSGVDAMIIAPSPIGPQRCAVRTVRRLTPQQVAALPPKARP
jgi:hypothetical protein